LDPRVLLWEAPAVAEAALQGGVARHSLDLAEYREQLAARQGQGQRIRRFIINQAKAAPQRIGFGEGRESKVIPAAALVAEEGIGQPIVLGRREVIERRIAELGLHFAPQIVNPRAENGHLKRYAQAYYEQRQRKGVTAQLALERVREPNIFGLMMVKLKDADT